jgi:hypothetical protein
MKPVHDEPSGIDGNDGEDGLAGLSQATLSLP